MRRKIAKSAYIVIATSSLLLGCSKTTETVSLVNKEFIVQVNEEVSTDPSKYITGANVDYSDATLDLSKVDNTKVGEYEGSITVGKQSLKFKIKVQDSVAPIITLKQETIELQAGEVLELSNNVTCEDNVDGDLTSQVSFDTSNVKLDEPGQYKVSLKVTDKSGNEATKEFQVIVKEKAPEPTPEMEPVKEPAVQQSAPSSDQMAQFNNYSNKNVSFGCGNKMDSKNRPEGVFWYDNLYGKYSADFIKTEEDKIYLTFDEGYEQGYTAQILDTLKQKNVKAVFFVTLPYAKSNPDLIKRMIDEGHIVGNHSVTHPANGLPSLSVEKQVNEVQQLHNYMVETYGYTMNLFRFPAGKFSEQSLAIVQSMGYRSVFWSFAYKDWLTDAQPSLEDGLTTCMNKLHGGAIYLLHAVSSTNTQILGDFIDQVHEKGYQFATYPVN